MERDQATELIHNLLRGMISKKASDMFITTGFPPAFKVDGKMTPVSSQVLNAQHTQELARSIMNDRQAAEFETTHECNFAISPHGIGRFRVNVFLQDRKSTRLNSSHLVISYAVFCLKKKIIKYDVTDRDKSFIHGFFLEGVNLIA